MHKSRINLPRVRAFILTICFTLALALGWLGTESPRAFASSVSSTPILLSDESFSGTTTLTPNWELPAAPFGANSACLTASLNMAQTPIPGCGGTPAAAGSGALQFTSVNNSEEGGVANTLSVPSSYGIDIKFDTYQYGGTGADGIAFFLAAANPKVPTPPDAIGQPGGALGYASAGADGLSYGYLGIGLDTFGNYVNTGLDGSGCTNPSWAAQGTGPQNVTVRGPGNGTVGYCLLNSTLKATAGAYSGQGQPGVGFTGTLQGTGPGAAARVPVEIVINPTAQSITTASGVTVPPGDYEVAFTPLGSGGTVQTLSGPLPTVGNGGLVDSGPNATIPSSWVNPTTGIPYQFIYGWVASTGGSTNVHEVNMVSASAAPGTNPPVLSARVTDNAHGNYDQSYHYEATVETSSLGGPEGYPVTITDNMPINVTAVPASVSGAGWDCSASTATVASCTYAASQANPIPAGSTLPTVRIPVLGTNSSQPTNTVVVSSDDAVPGSNSDPAPYAPVASLTMIPSATTVSPGSSLTVSGAVYDSTGAPSPYQTVELFAGSGATTSVPTNASGLYSASVAVPDTTGKVTLTAVAPGTSPPVVETTELTVSAASASGSASVSPTSVAAASSGNTLTFGYTAPAGGTSGGVVQLTVPSGWSPPQMKASASPGYVSASGGSGADRVSVNGDAVQVSGVTLAADQTLNIRYSDAAAPGSGGSGTFAMEEALTAAGTLTALSASATVTIATVPTAGNGSGTMNVSPSTVPASSTGNDLTFAYTAASGGTADGTVAVAVPPGWTAPQFSPSVTGYVYASGGSGPDNVTVNNGTIDVSGVTLATGQSLTLVYSDATAQSTAGTAIFTAKEASTTSGMPTALGTSPNVDVVGAAVSGVGFAPSPTTPGAVATWTVKFATSGTGGLSAGTGTITLTGPTGTVFPLVPGDYTIDGVPVTATPTQTAPNHVTLTVPEGVNPSTLVTVVAKDVTNPPIGASGSFSVSTSADPGTGVATSSPTFTSAQAVYVSTTGSDSTGKGTPASPYGTIAYAVSQAGSGGTVIVEPGSYSAPVTVTAPVTIESTDPGSPSVVAETIIDATGQSQGISVQGASAAGTVIDGLTIKDASGQGILVQNSQGVTVENNTLTGNGQSPAAGARQVDAIQLVGTLNSTVSGNTVTGDPSGGGIGVSDDGGTNPVGTVAGTANPGNDNTINGNTVSGVANGPGIELTAYDPGEGVTGNTVSGNTVTGDQSGVLLGAEEPGLSQTDATTVAQNMVEDNTITGNSEPGVIVDSTGGLQDVAANVISGNTVTGNGSDNALGQSQSTGVALYGGVGPVTGTQVMGNAIGTESYGLWGENLTGMTVSGNTFTKVGTDQFLLGSATVSYTLPSVQVGSAASSVTGAVYDGTGALMAGIPVTLTLTRGDGAADVGTLGTNRLVSSSGGTFGTDFTAPAISGEVTVTAVVDRSPVQAQAVEIVTPLNTTVAGAASASATGSATDCSATADTQSTTATATCGKGTVAVAQYQGNPSGPIAFQGANQYFDTALSAGNTFTAVTLTECNVTGSAELYWWNPQAAGGAGEWQAVVPQHSITCSNGSDGLTTTLSSSSASSPTLAQLTGTVFTVVPAHYLQVSSGGVPAPVVSGISPASGPLGGGTTVTITGSNFNGTTGVLFGTNAATGVTVVSDTEITAVSPAGTGTVSVAVEGTGGTSATSLADQFTYTGAACSVSFPDVPSTYWAAAQIQELECKGIVNGFPDGLFRPEDPVTRAQFVKMLVLTLGLQPSNVQTPFSDVPAGAWYAPYVSAAVQAGLVDGTSPTAFSPNKDLTREQMAVLLARALKLTKTSALTFTDAGQVDAWAVQGVEEAVAAGYMDGFPNGTFQPLGPTTRAQAAQVLTEVLSRKS